MKEEKQIMLYIYLPSTVFFSLIHYEYLPDKNLQMYLIPLND